MHSEPQFSHQNTGHLHLCGTAYNQDNASTVRTAPKRKHCPKSWEIFKADDALSGFLHSTYSNESFSRVEGLQVIITTALVTTV